MKKKPKTKTVKKAGRSSKASPTKKIVCSVCGKKGVNRRTHGSH